MKSIFFKLIVFSVLLTPIGALADETTHEIGNAVYAVRWARLNFADQKSPQQYYSAVKLLRQAQEKLAVDNESEAISLAQQAYAMAQEAIAHSR